MSHDLPALDAEILRRTQGVADALRNAMVYCRTLRATLGVASPEAKTLEDFIFLQTVEISALSAQVEARLAAYRDVVTAANQAILDVDTNDRDMAALLALMERCAAQMQKRLRDRIIDPAPASELVNEVTAEQPTSAGNVILFTGSFQTRADNDHGVKGGADDRL